MIKLTQKEKKCFLGLTKFPTLNDNQLSKKIGIKRSTITAIRNKLKQKDFYQTIAVPSLSLIGCEMLSVVYGSLNAKNGDIKALFPKISKNPNIIYCYFTDSDFFAVFVEKNYTGFSKDYYNFIERLEENNILKDHKIVNFPFEICVFSKLINFTGILKRIFDIDTEPDDVNIYRKPSYYKLSNKEKIVLKAIVKNPDESDTFISKKTKVARPTISSIKKKLLDKNLLHFVNIPNLQKIPCELLSLCYLQFKGDAREFAEKSFTNECNGYSFMELLSIRDAITIGIYEDYTVYHNLMQNMIKDQKENLRAEPENVLISIKEDYRKKLDFSRLVDYMLSD